ncbi:MAG: hypothetical protein KQI78_13680 [Deltaproteobacteria bacterium]|nr:hypothetical protein [Deltaproteobacteria bacterium]
MIPEPDIFSFDRLQSTVAFSGGETLYPVISAVLRDWRMENVKSGCSSDPAITLEKTSGGYARRSLWLSKPSVFPDPVDAVCDFIVDLIHAYVAEQDKCLCLHGAAVEIGSGLMVFPNTYRAGKSLLSLKLVSLGARLFSDDVLPINHQDNSGTALGILPRLRLPLPETAGPVLTNFIDHRAGPQNKRYRYIRLDEKALARCNTKAPVTAITILQRSAEAPPSLQPAKKSDVVRDMILRNFARQNPAIEIVDRFHQVVEQADCFILTYDTLDQAAELINDHFGIIPVGNAR